MNKLIIIDDQDCSSELDAFVTKHASSIRFEMVIGQDADLGAFQDRVNLAYIASKKIAIQTSQGLSLVRVNEIVHIEADGNYTKVNLSNGDVLTVGKSMKEHEEQLRAFQFLRIHNSHLINMHYLDKYLKNDGGYVLLTDGTQLPVSHRKKEDFFRMLSSF
jgi:two-component system LytT family response regulator